MQCSFNAIKLVVCCRLSLMYTLSRFLNITHGDSGGRISVLISDSSGHCEIRVHMNMCLKLDTYKDRAVWISKPKYGRFLLIRSDERRSLQKKGGWIYETNRSIILDAAAPKDVKFNSDVR
jgi:hypothetical protein